MTDIDGLSPRREETTAAQLNDLFGLTTAIEPGAFRELLDHLPIAVVVSKLIGGDQRVCYANKAFEALTGRALADFAGRGWSILAGFADESDPKTTLHKAMLKDAADYLGTFRLEGPKSIVVEAYAGLIQNDDGTENCRIAALIDVTDRARAEREEFARQIREKDLLLREVQHRVKNNLQLVISLIRLEARAERRGDKVNLATLAGRVESLHLLYQALTPSSTGDDVDLGHYVSQITTSVINTYAVEGIRLDIKVDHIPISVNVALSVGLVVNELLTNSFKYAFGGRGSGTISVECLRDGEEHYRVVVADDGAGLPAGLVWPIPGKISALMVEILRENTRATFDVRSEPERGVRTTIRFDQKSIRRVTN